MLVRFLHSIIDKTRGKVHSYIYRITVGLKFIWDWCTLDLRCGSWKASLFFRNQQSCLEGVVLVPNARTQASLKFFEISTADAHDGPWTIYNISSRVIVECFINTQRCWCRHILIWISTPSRGTAGVNDTESGGNHDPIR